MKCPTCGADTEVLDTRLHLGMFNKRRRKCFNNHITITYEVTSGALDTRAMKRVVTAGLQRRKTAQQRRVLVAANPTMSVPKLANLLGCTVERVRQLRKEDSK